MCNLRPGPPRGGTSEKSLHQHEQRRPRSGSRSTGGTAAANGGHRSLFLCPPQPHFQQRRNSSGVERAHTHSQLLQAGLSGQHVRRASHHHLYNGHLHHSASLPSMLSGPWYKHKTRPPISNEEKIKSEMCRNLLESGECPYGTGCRFAHHRSELKQIIRHPKHKTQLCKDYHGLEGMCMFGARCSYIHEPAEPKFPEPPELANMDDTQQEQLAQQQEESQSFKTSQLLREDVDFSRWLRRVNAIEAAAADLRRQRQQAEAALQAAEPADLFQKPFQLDSCFSDLQAASAAATASTPIIRSGGEKPPTDEAVRRCWRQALEAQGGLAERDIALVSESLPLFVLHMFRTALTQLVQRAERERCHSASPAAEAVSVPGAAPELYCSTPLKAASSSSAAVSSTQDSCIITTNDSTNTSLLSSGFSDAQSSRAASSAVSFASSSSPCSSSSVVLRTTDLDCVGPSSAGRASFFTRNHNNGSDQASDDDEAAVKRRLSLLFETDLSDPTTGERTFDEADLFGNPSMIVASALNSSGQLGANQGTEWPAASSNLSSSLLYASDWFSAKNHSALQTPLPQVTVTFSSGAQKEEKLIPHQMAAKGRQAAINYPMPPASPVLFNYRGA